MDDLDSSDESTPGSLPFGSPRFARLVRSPAARRLSPRRLGVGIGLGFLLCWGLVEAGTRLAGTLTCWVATLPEHQISFEQIELVPPPPPYIRAGMAGILASVQEEGKYDATVSTLNTDLEALRIALSRNPWIEIAGPVRSSYRHLKVQVSYRKPLALLVFDQEKSEAVLIDRNGVEMPSGPGQFAWAEKKPRHRLVGDSCPLVEIRGLGAGVPDRVGLVWKPTEPGVTEDKVRQAVRLAQFLADRLQSRTPKGQLIPDFPDIYFHSVSDGPKVLSGFFLKDSKGHWISWKSGPGFEAPDEPKAGEKWTMLARFLDAHGSLEVLEVGDSFLTFTEDRAIIRQSSRDGTTRR